ncbi:MAG TPA: HNH endonuclease, partial [Agitococcus sp.]|nr:HNH endonuclease [Agitococcus sp.]
DKYFKLLHKKIEPTVFPDEVDENIKYAEGKTKTVLVNSYERNQVARQKCIEHYGALCQICSFDFGKIYGNIGKDFIHVHHVVDIATIGNEYSVDPIKDLIPVCPNCHSMLHKKKPAYSIDELKEMMK